MQVEVNVEEPLFTYYSSRNVHGETIAELLQIFCIFVGIGTLPLIGEQDPRFLFVRYGLGLVTLIGGLWLVIQNVPRYVFRYRYAAFLRRFGRLRERFRVLRSRGSTTAVSPQSENNVSDATAVARLRQNDKQRLTILPTATILISLFTLILAEVTRQTSQTENGHLIAIYYSAPAILLWIAAEIFYIYPFLGVKPQRAVEVTGILRSLTKIVSALFLWVYLGLATGLDNITWMIYFSIVLALLSLVLGHISLWQKQKRALELKQQAEKRAIEFPQTAT